jgi:hypothetical protein
MFVTYLYINSRQEVVQQLPLLNENISLDICCHLPTEFLDLSASLHMDQENLYNRRGCGLNQAIILRLLKGNNCQLQGHIRELRCQDHEYIQINIIQYFKF